MKRHTQAEWNEGRSKGVIERSLSRPVENDCGADKARVASSLDAVAGAVSGKDCVLREKLSFFDWYADKERLPTDPPLSPEQETKWIQNFVKDLAWRRGAIHDGDCTDCPYGCDLCALEHSAGVET